jgi:D-arabinose 1-dehydrogenase-like Zn-dependent alcohol dehydrogenase
MGGLLAGSPTAPLRASFVAVLCRVVKLHVVCLVPRRWDMTCWHVLCCAIRTYGAFKAGERVLILGASGGVGTMAIQVREGESLAW